MLDVGTIPVQEGEIITLLGRKWKISADGLGNWIISATISAGKFFAALSIDYLV